MIQPEELYLLGKYRQQELIREVDQARLVKSTPQGWPKYHGFGSKANLWIRKRLFGIWEGASRTRGQQSISHPCCPVTKSQTSTYLMNEKSAT
jgi:hypothetical protein